MEFYFRDTNSLEIFRENLLDRNSLFAGATKPVKTSDINFIMERKRHELLLFENLSVGYYSLQQFYHSDSSFSFC